METMFFRRKHFLKLPGMTPSYFTVLTRTYRIGKKTIRPLLKPYSRKRAGQGAVAWYGSRELILAMIALQTKKYTRERKLLDEVSSNLVEFLPGQFAGFGVCIGAGIELMVYPELLMHAALSAIDSEADRGN